MSDDASNKTDYQSRKPRKKFHRPTKSSKLSYHRKFPETPMSWWIGARRTAWTYQVDATGGLQRIHRVSNPMMKQRKLWCLLEVHFDSIALRFCLPQEIDHFVDVLSQNPMPSGHSLSKYTAVGRPHGHWLARLPKKAKPSKFRQRLCSFLLQDQNAKELRSFYENTPVILEVPGFYASHEEARLAFELSRPDDGYRW